MLAYLIKGLVSGALAILTALSLIIGPAVAQQETDEAGGLAPSFGDGRLVVRGSGFKPGEAVALTVQLNGDPAHQFTTTADRQGRFRVATGLAVSPGTGVKLEARGNQGTAKAAITSVPASSPPGPGDPAEPTGQADFGLSNGHFYTQTSDEPGRGFAVTDDAGVAFWSEFQRLGGVQGVGYPISQRFVWDGFVSQAFQKMVFQWRPEVGRVYAINVIDLMHDRGLDEWLRAVRATPGIADWSSDRGRSWPEIVAAHQALLTDPDMRAAYFAVDDPVSLYGLPMAPIQDMGGVLVLRMQRGIIQKWLTEVPWARRGQATIANSGDVAKEAGLLPATALTPSAPPAPLAPPTSHGGPVRDYVSLIDNLRAAGATVEPVGEVTQPFFSVPGQVILVNGERVQVFEYSDAGSAAAAAARISPDGGTIGTTMVTWVGPPHFYRAGKIIVLYVGDSRSVIGALERVLGPQFAGR